MVRSSFDDITPPSNDDETRTSASDDNNQSIRKVAPVTTQERQTRRARRAERRTLSSSDVSSGKRRRKNTAGKYGLWGVAVVLLAIALSAVGFVFIGKTTIAVVPQQEQINLSENVVHTAYRDAKEGELAYSLVTHSIEATDTIPATGREEVSEKASGRIRVFNDHSKAPQRLIKNTRFESPSGEIYRVRDSLVVPGQNSDGSPGSTEVTVYADRPGESYNLSKIGTRFTIPGLKGDPRFDTFHAELTEPITGGFVGERAIVDETTLSAARTKLRKQLREQIIPETREQAPASTEIFEGGIFTEFESAPVTYAEDETATVREIARITAVSFDAHELARTLAATTIANPEDGTILIDSPESLEMDIVNKKGVDIINDALIQFTLSGRSTLTWQIDTEALKQDLVGKHSGALPTVMSGYSGIKSAQATIRPFWKKEFPDETDSIAVKITPEENE